MPWSCWHALQKQLGHVGLHVMPYIASGTATKQQISCSYSGRPHSLAYTLAHASMQIVATGGLSFPAVGTDGTGHRLLAKLGHKLKPTYPALTPLTGPHPAGSQLAGLSLEVLLECQTGKQRKQARVASRPGFLFTHRGYSGPSVLDVSHHAVMALERKSDAAPGEGGGACRWQQRARGGGQRDTAMQHSAALCWNAQQQDQVAETSLCVCRVACEGLAQAAPRRTASVPVNRSVDLSCSKHAGHQPCASCRAMHLQQASAS
jgi:hypothetical protein